MPDITGQDQVEDIQHAAALGGSASVDGAEVDVDKYESVGVTVYIQRDTVDTNVDVIVEQRWRADAPYDQWRRLDLVNLAVTAAAPMAGLDNVYAVTRPRFRVRVVNNTANGLLLVELGYQRKVIS